jgi:hypothetical protein
MLRSRVGDAAAVRVGAGVEGASARVVCCACSVVPSKKMARESETECFDRRGFDEKSWCIVPLGWFRASMLAAFEFWSGGCEDE